MAELRATEVTAGAEPQVLAGILAARFLLISTYRAACFQHDSVWAGPRRYREHTAGRDLTIHRRGHRGRS